MIDAAAFVAGGLTAVAGAGIAVGVRAIRQDKNHRRSVVECVDDRDFAVRRPYEVRRMLR